MSRTSKESWFQEGLAVLKKKGEAGLTIKELTERLNVTKGSFYHHFKNRRAFSEALLTYWEKHNTVDIIRQSSKPDSFMEKNLKLLTLSESQYDPELEVSIRAWALREPFVKRFQGRVDMSRLTFLQNLFSMLTPNETDVRTMSILRYCFYIGAQQIIPRLKEQEYKTILSELQHLFEGLLTRKSKETSCEP